MPWRKAASGSWGWFGRGERIVLGKKNLVPICARHPVLTERRQDTNLRLGPNWQAHLPRLVAMAVSAIPELHKKIYSAVSWPVGPISHSNSQMGGPPPNNAAPHALPPYPTQQMLLGVGLGVRAWREDGAPEIISPVHGKLGMYLCPPPSFYRQAAPARQPLAGWGLWGPIGRPICPVWLVVRPLFSFKTRGLHRAYPCTWLLGARQPR